MDRQETTSEFLKLFSMIVKAITTIIADFGTSEISTLIRALKTNKKKALIGNLRLALTALVEGKELTLVKKSNVVDEEPAVTPQLPGNSTDDWKIRSVTVSVNYNQSLEEMLQGGKYGKIHDTINASNFPISGNGEVDTEIFLVNLENHEVGYRGLDRHQIIAELDRLGYRPANIAELLAIGKRYPGLQRKFAIISLDKEVIQGSSGHFFPYLCSHGVRTVGLTQKIKKKAQPIRYAAVAK